MWITTISSVETPWSSLLFSDVWKEKHYYGSFCPKKKERKKQVTFYLTIQPSLLFLWETKSKMWGINSKLLFPCKSTHNSEFTCHKSDSYLKIAMSNL